MTTPALRALRCTRSVTLLTSSAGADIGRLIPEVDGVLVYDAPWMKPRASCDVESDFRTVERLRMARFDAAVVFTTCTQSALPAALLCYLAQIPLRLAHCRENPYQLLTDWVPDHETPGGCRHEVRRQLDLVASIGASNADERLSLRVPEVASARVARLLRERGLDLNTPWVCVHPGASASSRRYAPGRFAAAADEIHMRTGCPIVLAGGPHELDLVAAVRGAMRSRALSIAAELDLPDLAALIQQAALLVANNSGPAHIAAAVGTPVVDLYALTNPQHTPWQVPNRVLSHDVPCRNCLRSICPLGHNACLQSVSPSAVADAACELLAV